MASVARQRDRERSRSLSRLLYDESNIMVSFTTTAVRSRRSWELDLERDCERRRRRLKKQTFHRLYSILCRSPTI